MRPTGDNARLHAGQVVQLVPFLAKRCPSCEVTRPVEMFKPGRKVCSYCATRFG